MVCMASYRAAAAARLFLYSLELQYSISVTVVHRPYEVCCFAQSAVRCGDQIELNSVIAQSIWQSKG